jgi:aryl-alcohol dehydrogenase-like predicted oxidoreductase
MDYRKLGPSGTIVTPFCLGTMTFGAEADEAASHTILDDYFAWGGNFIDTSTFDTLRNSYRFELTLETPE